MTWLALVAALELGAAHHERLAPDANTVYVQDWSLYVELTGGLRLWDTLVVEASSRSHLAPAGAEYPLIPFRTDYAARVRIELSGDLELGAEYLRSHGFLTPGAPPEQLLERGHRLWIRIGAGGTR